MFPNTWKSLAFGLGLSVAGIALCAEQPGTLHGGKSKQAMAKPIEQEIQPVKFETVIPPAVNAAMQVKEFELELPPLNVKAEPKVELPPIRVAEEANIPLPPLSVKAEPKVELPPIKAAEEPKVSLPPLNSELKVGTDLPPLPKIEAAKQEPSKLFEPPAVKFDVPEAPLPAKPVIVETPALPPIPGPVDAPMPPERVPLKAVEPETIPSPRILETAVEAPPIVQVSIPKQNVPEAKPIANVPVPETKPLGNKHKLVVTLGDGKPRFEIRSIETNELVLSAVADHLEIHPESRYDPNSGRERLQRLVAEGDITFDAPDAAGTCKCLSILAGTGEVLLQAVEMKMKNQKLTSTIRSDKVVYQIGHGESPQTSSNK